MDTDQAYLYVLSQLFQYPDMQWRDSTSDLTNWLEDLDQKLHEGHKPLHDFMRWANSMTEEQRLTHYCRLFDFGKKTNLYLTYGSFGEERERGPELLSLKQIYDEAGFVMTEKELSDFLPLALEFASAANPAYAVRALELLLPGLETLHEELQRAETPYADLAGVALLVSRRLCQTNADHTSFVQTIERAATATETTAVTTER